MLLGNSNLLIFDEPTVGLDPGEKRAYRQLMQGLSDQAHDRIILVSSHELSELQSFCDAVIFLDQGKLLRAAGVKELFKEYRTDCLETVYFLLKDEDDKGCATRVN